jgi:hypothetical protein
MANGAEEGIVRTRIAPLFVVIAAGSALFVAGCGGGTTRQSPAPSPPRSSAPASAPPAAMKVAPGLYDLGDGTLRAVGTVEYRDLEGGFWAVVGEAEAGSDAGKVVAVISNGAACAAQLKELQGLSVIVDGTGLDDASTRMAGPEITATSVVAASDAPPPPTE